METLTIESALLKTFDLMEHNPVQSLFDGLWFLTFLIIGVFFGIVLFCCFEGILARITVVPLLSFAIAILLSCGINGMMSPLSGAISYNIPYQKAHAINPKLKPRYDVVMGCLEHSCILDKGLIEKTGIHVDDDNDGKTIKTVKGRSIHFNEFAKNEKFTLVSVETSSYEDTVHEILSYDKYRDPYMAFIKLSDGDIAHMPLSFIAAAAVPYNKEEKKTSGSIDTTLSSHFQNSKGK